MAKDKKAARVAKTAKSASRPRVGQVDAHVQLFVVLRGAQRDKEVELSGHISRKFPIRSYGVVGKGLSKEGLFWMVEGKCLADETLAKWFSELAKFPEVELHAIVRLGPGDGFNSGFPRSRAVEGAEVLSSTIRRGDVTNYRLNIGNPDAPLRVLIAGKDIRVGE